MYYKKSITTCAEGFEEKTLPNGEVVVTKQPPNAKLDTKTVTQIQNKLLELDFSYKPVVDSDLDSNINFNSLSTQEKIFKRYDSFKLE